MSSETTTRTALERLRAARADTLALLAELDQPALDARPDPERWSLGEIFDHLVRADEMFLAEIRVLADRQRRGRTPLVVRGLDAVGAPFGSWPLPLRLPMEGTVAFWNLFTPPVVREWLLGQRGLRAEAPEMLRPHPGRAKEALAADLEASLDEVAELVAADDLDLGVAVYYSPVVGFTNAFGLVRLLAQHDRRHQGQIREAREALS